MSKLTIRFEEDVQVLDVDGGTTLSDIKSFITEKFSLQVFIIFFCFESNFEIFFLIIFSLKKK